MMADRIVVNLQELHDAAAALRTHASYVADCSGRLPTQMPEAPPETAAAICEQVYALQTTLSMLRDELVAAASELEARAAQVEGAESRWWDIGPGGVRYGCTLPGGELVALTAVSSAFGPGIGAVTAASAASGGPAAAVATIGGPGTWPGSDIVISNAPTAPNIAIIGGGSVLGGIPSALGTVGGGPDLAGGPSLLGTVGGAPDLVGGATATIGGGPDVSGGTMATIGGYSDPDIASDPAWGPIFAAGNVVAASPASVNDILASGIVTSQIIRANAAAEQRLGAANSALMLGSDYTVRDGLSGAYVDRKYPYEY